MALPPSLAGAVQLNVTWPSPLMPETPVGAPAAVAGVAGVDGGGDGGGDAVGGVGAAGGVDGGGVLAGGVGGGAAGELSEGRGVNDALLPSAGATGALVAGGLGCAPVAV